jgi:hypothetical protein
MKPGDHPEFFRFPAPAGRSRESTIALDRRGHFSHDGTRVEHSGLATAFARWIRRHPDDGRWILENGYDWTYLTVEDTAYFVVGIRSESEPPMLRLSDSSEEALDPATLSIGDDEVLRVRVKGGVEDARFTREAQLALAPLLADDEPLAVVVAGKRYAIGAP